MSRKVILFIATSLDGFIAKEDDDLQWLYDTEGEGDNGYSKMYQTIDTTIMGKRTYEYVMEHTEKFPYPDKKCYVFTTSEQDSTEHVEFVNEDVVAFTKKLKAQQGANIWMIGGAGILDAFMKENLIDEYMITVTPTILGAGIPLFKEGNPEIAFTLLETKSFGQFVQLHYRVKR